MANAITLENQKQGTPESEWGLENGASISIEGFTTDISYNIGSTVDFKINTDTGDYRIDIYRLGYYDGLGARYIGTIDHHEDALFQPNPMYDSSTGLVDAGNWEVTDSWEIPSDATSGVYIAKLVREDGTFGENHIPFIVRNDGSQSDIVFKTSDETWQAYNSWGGNSVYESTTPAVALSYNRPFTTATGGGSVRLACDCGRGTCADCAFVQNEQGVSVAPDRPWNFIFGAEYPAIRWLERNGYDVSYVAGVDLARSGERILDHKVFLSVGHDEYWSGEQRAAVENARDAGVNLAFWSGNEVFWKTRWSDSIVDGTDYRTLITYKESKVDAKVDPATDWTGLWRDERFENGTEDIVPENALTGTLYKVDHDLANPLRALLVSSDYADHGLWRNTGVEDLAPGEVLTFANLIGYEWDINADNGYRPATLVEQSRTTLESTAVVLDEYAHAVGAGTATHSLTLYRADSGALVFGAGTVMWAWALDTHHALGPDGSGADTPEYPEIQQAMVNLFADMGVEPETLQDNLVPGGVPDDNRAPDVAVNPWLSNLKYYSGDTFTLSGTASDLEGHLAGVAVAVDGNPSFRASDTGDWAVSVQLFGAGQHAIKIRAFDTSLNVSDQIISIDIGYSITGVLDDFAVAQGWSNTAYKRIFADIDGDGVKDLVGFGESATLGYFGGTDPVSGGVGFRTPGTINVIIPDFAGAQGYTATSVRGVDYLGDFVGGGSKAATVWAQSSAGIHYYTPTSVGSSTVTYGSTGATYTQFGTGSGWNSSHTLDVGFVAHQSAFGSDGYGSVFGFGDAGLTLGRQAFAPGDGSVAPYLVAGSSAFGNSAGWSEANDIRAIRDANGHEIDLNHDGIVDVVGVGTHGTVYAFGQLTSDGAGGTIYSLGTTFTALNGASGQGSDFGTDQGWTKSRTPRFIADVNNDGYVDVIGFGDAGIYVSEGRAANPDGSGAFAQNYLAIADYGTASGWGLADHVRDLGDVNGDGVIDIIGFGDEKTIVATGAIDSQTGRISWTMDGLLGDFAITEGWLSSTHLRSVVDLNGDGKVEIFAAGDVNTRVIAQV